MTHIDSAERLLALPAPALLQLRQAIRKELGSVAATHALHDAGFASGESFFEAFRREAIGDPAGLPESRFWEALDEFFERRGWGRVRQERVHPAFGMLRASGWGESDPSGGERQPGCAISAGLFAYLFGAVGGGAFAVLEVGCRSRGDAECEFLVGGEGAIQQVYRLLLEGVPLDDALARL